MGRTSKLTEKEWAEIGSRLLKGESASALAREFKVSKTNISQRFSKRTETVKSVAHQVFAADVAFSSLEISEQIAVRSLTDELKAISMHLVSAAKSGAMTSSRLAGMALKRSSKIADDDEEVLDENAIKEIAALTRVSNMASEIGLNLLRSNKELSEATSAGKEEDGPIGKIVVEVVSARN